MAVPFYKRGRTIEGMFSPKALRVEGCRIADGYSGLVLGTPPSDRTPKVREDQMVYALKPTPGANVEDIHLRLSSVGKTKIREDPATQPSGRGVIKWVP